MKVKQILTATALLGAAAVTAQARLIERRSVSSKVLAGLMRLQPKKMFSPYKHAENLVTYEYFAEKNAKPWQMNQQFKAKYHAIMSSTYPSTYEFHGRYHDNRYTVIYLHGGRFWNQPQAMQIRFARKLADTLSGTVLMPIYPLAPNYDYQDVLTSLERLYREVLKTVDPAKLIIIGDSAGGGLALTLAEALKEWDLPQPKNIVALSPVLDVGLTNDEIRYYEAADPVLDRYSLQVMMGHYYAHNTVTTDWHVSPLYGDVTGLGRLTIFVGTRELLYPDAVKFREKAKQAGVDIDFFDYPYMMHNFFSLPLPETDQAFDQLIFVLEQPLAIG
ncbi:alpha/beta hydrolase fold domain-containing protein [Furfurilactobacillus curtus]|uniref:Alpha/beta hydrolase n=1 Tax=Furfurilactobacillus curtus TaxID=1746200 RepID=A0ABQ5JQ32_9LACO